MLPKTFTDWEKTVWKKEWKFFSVAYITQQMLRYNQTKVEKNSFISILHIRNVSLSSDFSIYTKITFRNEK